MSILTMWTVRQRHVKTYLIVIGALLAFLFAACQDDPTPPAPATAVVATTVPGDTGAATSVAGNATPTAADVAATATPAASATTAPTATPTADTDRGELVLWHSWAGADGEALAQILTSFQAANPDVRLQTLFVAYNELPQAYADAVYAGGGPDLILAPSWWLQDLVDAETLVAIDELVTAETLAAYIPVALANLNYQNHVYGLPLSFDLVSLYYNRNLVDAAALPTTTEEMLALAQATPSQGAGIYANFYHLFWGIPAYGGALFDAEGRVILEQNSAAADFLTWLLAMSDTPGVFVDLDYGMLIDRFKKGEFAFFIDGPWSNAELKGALGDALGITLLPRGPVGPARPWLNAEGVMLNPVYSPAQQQLALRLALHLSSAESGAILAQTAQRIPAQIGAPVADPILAGFMAQAGDAVPLANQPELDEVWGYTGDMLIKVINDVLSPVEAVLEASTLINEANDK